MGDVRTLQGNARQGRGPVAIVVARYNENITRRLLFGALETLANAGIANDQVTVAYVPGAWETSVVAARLARSRHYRAVICLAAVIRGETTHDIYINQQVSHSLGQLALETETPVLFGVLTCQSLEQALHRSGGNVGNKGSECAEAALEMADLMQQLATLHPSPSPPSSMTTQA